MAAGRSGESLRRKAGDQGGCQTGGQSDMVSLSEGGRRMAEYPGSEQETRIPPGTLARAVARIFVACGMSEAHPALLGGSLAEADRRGIHSHGTLRVPEYVENLTDKGVDPKGR